MSATVVLTEPLPEAGMCRLRAGAGLRLRILESPEERLLAEAVTDADGLIMTMERPALTADIVERARSLRVVSRFGAGYDNCDAAALTRRGIPLATTGAANAVTVAEHALYLMLALAKRGPRLDRAVRQGAWPRGFGAVELSGATCLVVGYGRIGREIARRAAAFDMRILISDPFVKPEEVARDGHAIMSLARALPQADFVVLAVPLTAATRGLIGASELGCMKRGAFLVNVARGAVVDQGALAAALAEARLAGAGLDVLEVEPPPPGEPLLSREDVVLTPHTGAYVRSAYDRMAVVCAENLLTGLAGRLDPIFVVNRQVLAA